MRTVYIVVLLLSYFWHANTEQDNLLSGIGDTVFDGREPLPGHEAELVTIFNSSSFNRQKSFPINLAARKTLKLELYTHQTGNALLGSYVLSVLVDDWSAELRTSSDGLASEEWIHFTTEFEADIGGQWVDFELEVTAVPGPDGPIFPQVVIAMGGASLTAQTDWSHLAIIIPFAASMALAIGLAGFILHRRCSSSASTDPASK